MIPLLSLNHYAHPMTRQFTHTHTHRSGAGSIPSLYVLKAALAFAVVSAHAPLAGIPSLNLPGGLVELFFAITGYFLYSPSLAQVQSRLWRSLRKVLPMLIALQLFYNLIAPPHLGKPWEAYWQWFQWLFLGFSSFSSGHLWYLTALVLGLLFFVGYLRLTGGRGIPWLFLLILLWAALDSHRILLFGKPMSVFSFNFLSRAVPFLAMGYWIRQNEERLLRYPWLNIYLGLMILAGVEYLATYWISDGATSASLLQLFPLPFALFMLALSYRDFGAGTWLESIGQRYAGNIYYFHMALILLWRALLPTSPILTMLYERGGAFVVYLLSLLVAWLIVRIQNHIGYHLFR